MSSGRKGQFFIIGAVLICSLLYFGLSPSVTVSVPEGRTAGFLADNIANELPYALNLGINGSGGTETLANFTAFAMNAASETGMQPHVAWVVISPSGSALNVSFGNFYSSTATAEVNISGSYKAIYAGDSSVNSTLFSAGGYTYTAWLSVPGGSVTFEAPVNKTALYAVVSLDYGEAIARKEILA